MSTWRQVGCASHLQGVAQRVAGEARVAEEARVCGTDDVPGRGSRVKHASQLSLPTAYPRIARIAPIERHVPRPRRPFLICALFVD